MAPPLRGGLLAYAPPDQKGGWLGLGLTQGGGLLGTAYNGQPIPGGLLGAAGRAGAGALNDVGNFALRNVLPGSSDAQALTDAWANSGRARDALATGDYGNAALGYANMGGSLLGLLPFGALATKGIRSLPAIGDVGKDAFKAMKVPSDVSGETAVFRNPTEEQMRHLASRDKYTMIRWTKAHDGNVYVWPAWDMTHDAMHQALGYETAPIAAGQMTYDKGEWFVVP